MTTRILHLTKRHPLTGKPLEAAGVLPSGRIVWPIMGAAPDPPAPTTPQRPEDVSEEEWNALGDPGKAALGREREARQKPERELAAAKAPKPTPPPTKAPPAPAPAAPAPAPAPAAASATGEQQDIAAIVQQAVTAAIKPFQDAEAQRTAEAAAGKVRDTVLAAAESVLHDKTDALGNIDLTTAVNDQGVADAAKIKSALDTLLTQKPHLAKTQQRFAPPGIGGGAPAPATDAEKVKAVLADMQKATGVRPPAATN